MSKTAGTATDRTLPPARIISGSGRSGTTWVQTVLAEANGLKTVFEPLKPLGARVPNYENAYLTKNSEAADLKKYLERVFSGSHRSIWTDHQILPINLCPNSRNIHSMSSLKGYIRRWQRLYKGTKRLRGQPEGRPVLVKFIRANLMMEWLIHNFNVKAAFVLRHPGAVVESQIRLGGNSWNPRKRLTVLLQQKQYQSQYHSAFASFSGRDLSLIQMNTLIWCMENHLPLLQASQGLFQVFSYEQLVANPHATWSTFVRCLELENIPAKEVLEQPSQQASDYWKLQGASNSLHAWMERLTASDKNEMQKILDIVGIESYSMSEPMPQLERF